MNASDLEKKAEKAFTLEQLKTVLEYDKDTGYFHWIVYRARGARPGMRAGTISNTGHIHLGVFRKMYLAHRLAWFYHYGSWPINMIDHINGDPKDNRITNLRDVTKSVNSQNQRKPRIDNQYGIKGIFRNTSSSINPWTARITINKVKQHIGNFPTAQEAHQAYLKRKREIHPGCTI